MKVLVTGGAGFIGSHIVDKLIQEDCRVVVVDNLSTGVRENIHKSATFVKMDIGSPDLPDLFVREQFDYVIHQAAQTMVDKSIKQPDYDSQVNIAGSINVLEACRKTAVKRIVFASTAAVYGDVQTVPIVETAAKQPTSFYGLSKLTVEQYLALYSEIFGLEYIGLRYANVYGERQGDAGEGGVISIFTRLLYHNQPVTIYGDGGQTRDFIYVSDVAAANYQALFSAKCNQVFNISTQTETALHTLLGLLEQTAQITAIRQYQPPREGDIYRSSLSNTTARQELSWQPVIALPEGLARTYHGLKSHYT